MGSFESAPAAVLAGIALEPQHRTVDAVAEEVAARAFDFHDVVQTMREHKTRRWLTGVELTDEDQLVREITEVVEDAARRLDKGLRDSLVFYMVERFAAQDAAEGMAVEHDKALAAKTA